MKYPHIYLASNSPRRRAILEQLGIVYTACPSNINENSDIQDPNLRACSLAEQKAKATKSILEDLGTYDPDSIILAADTIVAISHKNSSNRNSIKIFEKPNDVDEAKMMLLSLSGKRHHVYTGHCFLQKDTIQVECEITQVNFFDINEQMLDYYLRSKEWEGASGGYKIQGLGAIFVSSIQGSFSNVMGLSIPLFMKYLNPF